MAHLWIATGNGGHAVLALEQAEHALPAGPWPFTADAPAAATLIRVDARDTWALVARDERVRVNGVAIPAGLAIVADKDEILVPGVPPMWFSTETIARISKAPALDGRALSCPRCRRTIEVGTPAVACPSCRVWHHQTPELPCFTYDAAPCGACGERFDLDGAFRWCPDEL